MLLLLPLSAVCGSLCEIYINPGAAVVNCQTQQRFEVIGLDSQGKQVPVSEPVTWTANSATGTIDQNGLFTAGLSVRNIRGALTVTLPSGLSAQANIRTICTAVSPNYVLERVLGGDTPGQLSYPTGMAITPQGHLIVSDYLACRLQEFDEQGRPVRAIGGPGTASGLFEVPNGVAVDTQANIYVADTGNARVQKLNPLGQPLLIIGSQAGAGALSYPMGVAVDAAGNIYVADWNRMRILKYNASGQLLTSWELWEPTDGSNYTDVCGVAVDPLGFVYGLDASSNRVKKFTSDGTLVKSWIVNPQLFSVEGPMPMTLTVDNGGNVYVAVGGSSDVSKTYVFDTDGRAKLQIDRLSTAVAVTSDGTILLTGYYGISVSSYSSSGSYLGEWVRARPGIPNTWSSLATDANGNVYVADKYANYVEKLDRNGHVMSVWGSPGRVPGLFNCPESVAVDHDGSVYVRESLADGSVRILKLDSTTSQWEDVSVQHPSSVLLQFFEREGDGHLALDSAGNLYALARWGATVQKFDCNANLLTSWNVPFKGSPSYLPSLSLAVDPNDTVCVMDYDGTMTKYDGTGRQISQSVLGGILGPGADKLDMAFAPDGTLYVFDSGNTRIEKYVSATSSIGRVKSAADGSLVYLSGSAVTAGTDDLYDCFYIESSDGSTGIKVTSLPSVYRAQKASMVGTVSTIDGERTLNALAVSTDGTATVAPVAMSNSSIGGGAFLGQPALWRWQYGLSGDPLSDWTQMMGLNTTGLLIKTWGRVVSVDSDWWTIRINDGSLPDGSSVKCVAPYDAALPEVGDFVTITGVSAVEMDESGFPVPLIRTRSSYDMSILGH